MRYQSLTFFSAVLLTTTSLSNPIHAQKGITLQPHSPWVVKNVEDNGQLKYCAIARKFDQNLILTIAENLDKEASLALDFARGSFVSSQEYLVSFDAGMGQLRRFNVSPSSEKAFVIRLGRDEDFMNALNSTGHLRVGISSEFFNFNLEDIDVGRKELLSCLNNTPSDSIAGGTGIEGVSVVSKNAPIANGQERTALLDHIRALENENERLKVNIGKVRAQEFGNDGQRQSLSLVPIESLEKNVSEFQVQNTKLLSSLRALREEKDQIYRDLQLALQEKEELEGHVLRQEVENSRQLQNAQNVQQRILDLESEQAQMLSRKNLEISELRKQLSEQNASIAMAKEIEESKVKNIEDQYKTKILGLQSQVQNLSTKLELASTEMQKSSQLETELAQKEQKIEILQRMQLNNENAIELSALENSKLVQKTQELEVQLSSFAEKDLSKSEQIKRSSSERNAILTQQKKLEDALNQALLKNKGLENKLIRLSNSRRSENEALLQDYITENKALKESLLQVEAKLKNVVSSNNAQKNTQDVSEINNLNAIILRLQDEIKRLKQEARTLKVDLEQAQAMNASLKKNVIGGSKPRFINAVEEIQQKNKKLKEKLLSVSNETASQQKVIRQAVLKQSESIKTPEPIQARNQSENSDTQITVVEAKGEEAISVGRQIPLKEKTIEPLQIQLAQSMSNDMNTSAFTDAQRQEMQMKKVIGKKEEGQRDHDFAIQDFQPVKVDTKDLEKVLAQPENNIEIQEMSLEDFEALEDKKELSQEIIDADALNEKQVQQIKTQVAVQNQNAIDLAADLFSEEDFKGHDKIKPLEIVRETSEEKPNSGRSDISTIKAKDQKSYSVSKKGDLYAPQIHLDDILALASLAPASGLDVVERVSNSQKIVYQWRDAHKLFGSAQQRPIVAEAQFDDFVKDYLSFTESRCAGDFAIVPIQSKLSEVGRIDSYDIACINGEEGSSASVVFFEKQGVFTALSHEAEIPAMDSAMDARDKVFEAIEKS